MKRLTLALSLLFALDARAVDPATQVSGIAFTANATTPIKTTQFGLWVDAPHVLHYNIGVTQYNVMLGSSLTTDYLTYATAANTIATSTLHFDGTNYQLHGGTLSIQDAGGATNYQILGGVSGLTTNSLFLQSLTLSQTVLFVRTAGNDSNNCLTALTACRTVQHALDLIPIMQRGGATGNYVVDITGINDTLTTPLIIPPYYNEFPDTINFSTPYYAAYIQEGYVNIDAIPTVVSTLNPGTTTTAADAITGMLTYTDTSQAYTPGALAGKFLVDVFGDEAVIQSNTATQLVTTATAPFADPVQVVSLGATLTMNAMGGTFIPDVIWNNVKAEVVFNGIKLVPDPGSLSNRSFEIGNSDAVILNLCDFGAVATTPINSSGARTMQMYSVYLHDTWASHTTFSVIADEISMSGWIYGIAPVVTSMAWTVGGYIENGDWIETFGGAGSPISFFGASFLTSHHGLFFDSAYPISLVNVRVNDATPSAGNPNGSGIYVTNNTPVFIAGNVGGTGNTGYGLEVGASAHVTVAHIPTFVTPPYTLNITGALGDIKVGTNPVRTWSDFDTGHPRHNEIDALTQMCRLGFDDTTAEQITLPLQWSWRTSDGVVVANTLVTPSPANDGRVITLVATSSPSLATGIALDAAGGAGTQIRIVELRGQVVTVKSDGALAIAPGDALGVSATSNGRVTKVGAGGFVGRSVSTAGAAADALVNVYFGPDVM